MNMQVFPFECVDSTNDAAKRLIAEGRINGGGAYVFAREQTAGKGTRGRRWLSPKGAGVYLSVVHVGSPAAAIPVTPIFARSAGIACVEVLRDCFDLQVWIRPINDLWANGRKLGGILIETLVQNTMTQAIITGIGINVRNVPRPLAPPAPEAVSLEELLCAERFSSFDFATLPARLAEEIDRWHCLVINGNHARIEDAWVGCSLAMPIEYPAQSIRAD